ncbi:MAG: hypothetical protein ACLUD2_04005 [Clostridium sp.]
MLYIFEHLTVTGPDQAALLSNAAVIVRGLENEEEEEKQNGSKTVQAVINGTTVTLTYNSSTGKYEATVTAPSKSSYNVNSGHYYPVTTKATDAAGNTTTKTDTDTLHW